MCHEVAYSKATGLIYSNVEWVNSVDTLTALPHPATGASPPGRSVVDGWCRDERTRDIPQSLPRSLVSAAKPTTGIQVVRACRPSCLNSLTPDAHRAGPLHPSATEAEGPRGLSLPASTCG